MNGRRSTRVGPVSNRSNRSGTEFGLPAHSASLLPRTHPLNLGARADRQKDCRVPSDYAKRYRMERLRESQWRRWGGLMQPLVVWLLAREPNGFAARGRGWRAAWVGAAKVDYARFRKFIKQSYDGVCEALREEFALSVPRSYPIAVICGEPPQMRKTFRLSLGAYKLNGDRLNLFIAPDIVTVAAKPNSPSFRGILAHELCHALTYQVRGQRPAAPWIDEGAAEFVAAQKFGRRTCWMLRDYADCPEDFRLRASLGSILAVEATLDDDEAQSVLLQQAGLFIAFLWQSRSVNAAPWDTACRALAGCEPETTLPAKAIERAFGMTLNAIERVFHAWCVDSIRQRSAESRQLRDLCRRESAN